jgi:hypothetical protein
MMEAMAPPDRPAAAARLATAVISRRLELGYSPRDVERLGGPSRNTLRQIETATGAPPRAGTLNRLDIVLRWATGSSENLYRNGIEPQPAGTQPQPASPAAVGSERENLVRGLAAWIATLPAAERDRLAGVFSSTVYAPPAARDAHSA